MSRLREDIRPGLRILVEGNYLLLYEHDASNDAVELVAVIDRRRDLSELFETYLPPILQVISVRAGAREIRRGAEMCPGFEFPRFCIERGPDMVERQLPQRQP